MLVNQPLPLENEIRQRTEMNSWTSPFDSRPSSTAQTPGFQDMIVYLAQMVSHSHTTQFNCPPNFPCDIESTAPYVRQKYSQDVFGLSFSFRGSESAFIIIPWRMFATLLSTSFLLLLHAHCPHHQKMEWKCIMRGGSNRTPLYMTDITLLLLLLRVWAT